MEVLWNDEEFGTYEKRLCFLLFFATIPNAFPVLQPLVTQYTPNHYCDVRSILNVTTNAEVGVMRKPAQNKIVITKNKKCCSSC